MIPREKNIEWLRQFTLCIPANYQLEYKEALKELEKSEILEIIAYLDEQIKGIEVSIDTSKLTGEECRENVTKIGTLEQVKKWILEKFGVGKK